MRKDAFTSVGTVTREDDFVVGIPLSYQADQLEGQFGSSAMVGIRLQPFSAALLPLCESLPIAVEPHGDRQSKDLRGGPEWVDDNQAKHDPVVSPTDQRFGTTGD